MVAGRFRTHSSSLMPIPGEPSSKLLPITAIYGGNASGKSTFVHAMKCLRRIVLTGKVTHVEPHLFAAEGKTTPTSFKCIFVSEDRVKNVFSTEFLENSVWLGLNSLMISL